MDRVIEQISLKAWPAFETINHHGWVMRLVIIKVLSRECCTTMATRRKTTKQDTPDGNAKTTRAQILEEKEDAVVLTDEVTTSSNDDRDADNRLSQGESRAIELIAGESVTGSGAGKEESGAIVKTVHPEIVSESEKVEAKEPPLTDEERKDFEKFDQQAKEGFLSAAQALTEIRNRKLYREFYSTFEDYCEKQLGFTKRLAYYSVVTYCLPALSIVMVRRSLRARCYGFKFRSSLLTSLRKRRSVLAMSC
ncbi:hypothetical protein G7B40_000025 [Aetokthonos hydrillicola Thurmond2011]|jgi:hypothetical protein|uniref:Uncharacterized protein n=1 Tax=Aetokthonos hydrillicola Thurmond2011 TaxID=2712845 RepID=A0AAP5M2Q6_9CYAN|nr:hypothetical protein [Aetokthonos hydrillicola]MBO3464516.1 hypothetical protein [Aetokthonos hydrillicola CCALA 1050]MDR9892971.1 hypothetical protein [Aetokthonos hydrillicola Thurmond2011]